MAAYRRVIGSNDVLSNSEYYHKIVNTPTSRFFISLQRAYMMLVNVRKNILVLDKISMPLKREMYKEIYRRFIVRRKYDDVSSDKEILSKVINSQAPRFYISARSAELLINNLRKKCRRVRR